MKIINRFIFVLFNGILLFALLPFFFIARFIEKKIDIGIGPLPMINNYHWAIALRLKGYSVETYVNDCYFIICNFDVNYKKVLNGILDLFPPIVLLLSCYRYKIFYLYFNGGVLMALPVLKYIEPFFIKLSKSKIVVMPYGSDVQVFTLTRNKQTVNELCKDYRLFKYNNESVRRQVNVLTRYSDTVIGAMDSVDYLFYWDKLIPCHFAIDTNRQYLRRDFEEEINILHVSNHFNIKGTYFIIEAIEKLQSEGYKINFTLLHGKPNEEVLKCLIQSDLVIDQLVMGWYAMFALEAMSYSKPVVCYLREDLIDLYVKTNLIKREELPLINADTSNIYYVLKRILDDRNILNDLSVKSYNFVQKYNSYETIGSFFDSINKSLLDSKQ